MNRRRFLSTLGPALMLTHARRTMAQEKTYRIGLLMRAAPDVPIADYLRESVRRRADAQYIARLVSAAKIEGIELAGANEMRVH